MIFSHKSGVHSQPKLGYFKTKLKMCSYTAETKNRILQRAGKNTGMKQQKIQRKQAQIFHKKTFYEITFYESRLISMLAIALFN